MLLVLGLIIIIGSYLLIGFILSFFIQNKDNLEALSLISFIVIFLSVTAYINYKEDTEKIKQYFNLTENEIKQLNDNDIKDLKEKIYEIETKNIKNKINEKYNYIK